MKRIELPNQNYLIKWEKADELPLKRYARFQKYLLLKTGIGDNIESIGEHFQNLHEFLAYEKNEESKTEAENLHYNFFSILQEINYEDLAFAALVYSINGEVCEDFSDEGLSKTVDKLSDLGMTKGMVSQEVADTRQIILKDLKLYFPKFYPESDDFTYFQKIKQKMLITADKIIDEIESGNPANNEIEALLKELSVYFIGLRKPKNFDPSDTKNAVVKMQNQFEGLCSIIEQNGGTSPKDFSLIEFYARLEAIRKANQPSKK